MRKISDRIVDGKATPEDIQTLEDVAYQIDGRTVCAFGEASSWPVEAIIALSILLVAMEIAVVALFCHRNEGVWRT